MDIVNAILEQKDLNAVLARCGKRVDLFRPKEPLRLGSTKEFYDLFCETTQDFLDVGVSLVFVCDGLESPGTFAKHSREKKWREGRKAVSKWFDGKGGPVVVVDRILQRVAVSALRRIQKDAVKDSIRVLRCLDRSPDWHALLLEHSAYALLSSNVGHCLLSRVPVILMSSLDYSTYAGPDEDNAMFACSLHSPETTAGAFFEAASPLFSSSPITQGRFLPASLGDLAVLVGISEIGPIDCFFDFSDRILGLAKEVGQMQDRRLASLICWMVSAEKDEHGRLSQLAWQSEICSNDGAIVARVLRARRVFDGRYDEADQDDQILSSWHERMEAVRCHWGADVQEEYLSHCLSVDMLRLICYNMLPFDNRLEPRGAFDMERRVNAGIGHRLGAFLGLEYVESYSWDGKHLMITKENNLKKELEVGDLPNDGFDRVLVLLGIPVSTLESKESETIPLLTIRLMRLFFPEIPEGSITVLRRYFSVLQSMGRADDASGSVHPLVGVEDLGVVYVISCFEICLEWIVNINDACGCAAFPRETAAEQVLDYDPVRLAEILERWTPRS